MSCIGFDTEVTHMKPGSRSLVMLGLSVLSQPELKQRLLHA
jgi:hypothetical protein